MKVCPPPIHKLLIKMKYRVMRAITQAVLLASNAIALGNEEHELKDRGNAHCTHIHEHVDAYHAETFMEAQNTVSAKLSGNLYTHLAVEPEATHAYSKYPKHHRPVPNVVTIGPVSGTLDLELEAAYTNIKSIKTKHSPERISEYPAKSSKIKDIYGSSTAIHSDPIFTSDSDIITPSTTARTSSHSTSTNTISTTRPLSTFALCPYYEGWCSGEADTLPPLFYIRCARSLADDATTNFNCAPQPSLTYEGECNEACFNDPTCKAWSGSYEVPGVGFPNGTYDCCHVHEEIALKPNVPAPVDAPLVIPFSGSSYGVRGLCPLGSTEMCPYYDSQCVEGIQVHCGRSLGADTGSVPVSSALTNDMTQYDCHQSCVKDPTCTAWDGYYDVLDLESGGGLEFECYHYNSTFVLKPDIPPKKPNTNGYGLKGC